MHHIKRQKSQQARGSSCLNASKLLPFGKKFARSVEKSRHRSTDPTNAQNIQDVEQGTGQSLDIHKPSHLTVGGQLKAAFLKNWLNILLIFVPIGIASHFANLNPNIVFVMNFIGIIPLAGLLSYATEELAIRVGEVLGGLLNATFGNAVELIVSIIALTKREVLIVQTSLIGSILSNLLLVLGMAFIAGGFNRFEQEFNNIVAQTSIGLLTVAIGALIIPTAFHSLSSSNDDGIIQLSRATAIILLLVYVSYIFFQLKSHKALFSESSAKNEKREFFPDRSENREETADTSALERQMPATTSEGVVSGVEKPVPSNRFDTNHSTTNAKIQGDTINMNGRASGPEASPESTDEHAEVPELSIIAALLLLLMSTVFVALCAEFLVGSIDSLVSSAGISKVFVGLILLPIVGNAAEHYTAVTVAVKDKMDLSVSVAVGSSLQISLLVIPLMVILGWILKIDEMTLYFDVFQVTVLFIAILLVNYLIQDGRSNYLEGNLLLAVYLIIAVGAWFYPKDGPGVATE